jgi:hypothetical protein
MASSSSLPDCCFRRTVRRFIGLSAKNSNLQRTRRSRNKCSLHWKQCYDQHFLVISTTSRQKNYVLLENICYVNFWNFFGIKQNFFIEVAYFSWFFFVENISKIITLTPEVMMTVKLTEKYPFYLNLFSL